MFRDSLLMKGFGHCLLLSVRRSSVCVMHRHTGLAGVLHLSAITAIPCKHIDSLINIFYVLFCWRESAFGIIFHKEKYARYGRRAS